MKMLGEQEGFIFNFVNNTLLQKTQFWIVLRKFLNKSVERINCWAGDGGCSRPEWNELPKIPNPSSAAK